MKVTAEPGSITVKFDPVEGLDSDHYWVMMYEDETHLSTKWSYPKEADRTTFVYQWTGLKAGTYYFGISSGYNAADIAYFTATIKDK